MMSASENGKAASGLRRAVNFRGPEAAPPSRNCCLMSLMGLSDHSHQAEKELIAFLA